MPRHHEKKDRNAILRLKHICRPLKSYCIWVATKFFVYKSWGELFFTTFHNMDINPIPTRQGTFHHLDSLSMSKPAGPAQSTTELHQVQPSRYRVESGTVV